MEVFFSYYIKNWRAKKIRVAIFEIDRCVLEWVVIFNRVSWRVYWGDTLEVDMYWCVKWCHNTLWVLSDTTYHLPPLAYLLRSFLWLLLNLSRTFILFYSFNGSLTLNSSRLKFLKYSSSSFLASYLFSNQYTLS